MLPDFGVSQILPPTSHGAGALTTNYFSIKGFQHAIILVEIGNSTSLGLSACDLYTGDGANQTAEQLVGSLAPCGTSPDQIVAFSVNLTEMQEYMFLHLTLQGSGTAIVSATAVLLDPNPAPPASTGLGKEKIIP